MVQIAFYAPLLAVGGTQRHLQQVLRLLDRERFRVSEIVTLRSGGAVEAGLREDGWSVRSLEIGTRLFGGRALRVMAQEARRLRRARVDVIQAYQWRPSLIAGIVGRLAGVPLIVAGKRSLTGSNRQAQLAWRVIGRVVDCIVTNADALRAEAEAQGTTARWEILRNGVDVDYFAIGSTTASAKAALGLDPTRPVVGSVGRLESRKGHPLLVAAARRLADRPSDRRPQILLVGDGPLRESLRRQADELGLGGDVCLAGELADVRAALAAIDVFVLPSLEEGMSNALLEAMAAGRPIVATDVGGTREVLGDDAGLLVPPDDAPLAEAIRRLMDDPTLASTLGREATARVESRFGARRMMRALESLYAGRLGGQGDLAA